MYRSWAYIMMVTATLAGMVALLWPSPPVRTIEEIPMPSRPAPRAEASAKSPKSPSKAGQARPAKPTPAPPAVINRMPEKNTTVRRAAPVLENGLQPNMFGKPVDTGVQTAPVPGSVASGARPGSTILPPKVPAPPKPPSAVRPPPLRRPPAAQ